jgi:hypothetical protein
MPILRRAQKRTTIKPNLQDFDMGRICFHIEMIELNDLKMAVFVLC